MVAPDLDLAPGNQRGGQSQKGGHNARCRGQCRWGGMVAQTVGAKLEDEVVLVIWRARSSIVDMFCSLELVSGKSNPTSKGGPREARGEGCEGTTAAEAPP